MQRILLIVCFFLVRVSPALSADDSPISLLSNDSIFNLAKANFQAFAQCQYQDLNEPALTYEAYEQGITGYMNMLERNELSKSDYLTIIDFSQPSSDERLFIIDVCHNKVIHQSLVAHGKNSGKLYARDFSNEANSLKSSIGFYITATTYTGKYDLALRLEGMEYSNSHASSRGVVMHAAEYANPDFLEANGCSLGRSYGCPALPEDNFEQVVNWIKEGSCLFIYYPSRSYKRHSKYLNRKNYLTEFI